jgi:hypothetical protein
LKSVYGTLTGVSPPGKKKRTSRKFAKRIRMNESQARLPGIGGVGAP